jgi:hypothetical protein
MKLGQRKIDVAPITRALAKNPPVEATPVMTKNLGWINNMVGKKTKPAINTAKAKQLEEVTRVNSYKPQANLTYLNMLLKK